MSRRSKRMEKEQEKQNELEPIELPELNARERELCALGIQRFRAFLTTKLAKDATDIGFAEDAQRYSDQAAALETELIVETEDGVVLLTVEKVYTRHRPALKKGLEILARNIGAAKGTMKALGHHDVISELAHEAKVISEKLVPIFTDQHEIEFDEDGESRDEE